MSARGVVSRAVVRLGERGGSGEDDIAVEEPLEIRVAGETLAITMRTPGDDERLAAGFLLSEGIVSSAADIGTISRCGRPGDEGYGNVIDVAPGPGTSLDIERSSLSRRGTLTTSACGVCGRRTIDDLLARRSVIEDDFMLAAKTAPMLMRKLSEAQPIFARTGGLHAAGAFDAQGETIAIFEDVGRHNAVDKLVGELLLRGKLPARATTFVVSGRASFELVHKTAVAGAPILLSVSAASSLAIDLAIRAGVTLAAFVRGGSMSVYSRSERIG